uniref:RNA-directed DNA polymerase n=1 Tax=Molossus molossus TaxID=27622 RepID=A0A7J8JX15_MOLMO|nr:hypothetical protein HJG59_007900 [Molossus molossus]
MPRPRRLNEGILLNIKGRTNSNSPKTILKIQEEERLPNSFYEASIILISKSDKDTTKKENSSPIFLINTNAKILNKILANLILQYIKKIIHHDKAGFFPVMQGWYNIHKSKNVIHHINKMKDKHHTIISIDAEKAFDKIQHPFLKKTLSNVGTEGSYLDIIKAIYEKTYSQHYIQRAKTKSISLKNRNKSGMPIFTTLIQHNTGSLNHSNYTRRKNKRDQIRKEEVKLSFFADDIILS